jgi:hypothetical protein
MTKPFGFLFGFGLAFIIVNNPQYGIFFTPFTSWLFIFLTMPFLIGKKQVSALLRWNNAPMLLVALLIAISMGAHSQLTFLNSMPLAHGILAPIIFTLIVLGVYMAIKTHTRCLEIPFAIMLVISTTSITYTALTTGLKGSGFISPMNYDIAPILIIFTLIAPKNWRWWMSVVAVVGLFFSGSEIGLVAIAIVVLVLLVRRDWSSKILLPIIALVVCFLVSIPTGVFHDLWIHNGLQITLGDRIDALMAWRSGGSFKELDYLLTGNRLMGEWQSLRPITLLGHGYMTGINPANQFLTMTDQVGIITALSWVAATLAWGIKTKNYYLLSVILVVGTFDVFFWKVGMLWWWALMGVGDKGLIYRRIKLWTI